MFDQLSIENVVVSEKPLVQFSDFRIGKIILSKHLGYEKPLISVKAMSVYVRQLLLEKTSDFDSGRVPLYVCECCADIGCGALTVKVSKDERGIHWRDFGNEAPYGDEYTQSEYMKRTGPFLFDLDEYRHLFLPYAKG